MSRPLGPLALAAVLAGLGAIDDRPIDRMVGDRVASFTLPDAATGREVSLDDYRGEKLVVVVFTGIDCPIGNKYAASLAALSRRFEGKGVTVLGVNANASETAEQIAAHAKDYALGFPVLRDAEGRVARALRAERTCEALLIDREGVLRYRGAIDDQFTYRTTKAEPDRRYLEDAIEAVRAGRAVEPRATAVVGCPIEQDDLGTGQDEGKRGAAGSTSG